MHCSQWGIECITVKYGYRESQGTKEKKNFVITVNIKKEMC
jgi:hypothetical protein